MATPSTSRQLPPGRTPGSTRKVSDSHTLRALSQADTPKSTRPVFSGPRQSMPYPGSVPRALPATPATGARRRSLKDRTPRQVLAAQRLQPKSARKSLGRLQGKDGTPSNLLRMLSRMNDLPPDTPDEPPARTSLAPSERRRSSLLSRPSLGPADISLDAIPETQQPEVQLSQSDSFAPIASTSSSPPGPTNNDSFDPFRTSHSASFSASYATSHSGSRSHSHPQPVPLPNSLSRSRQRANLFTLPAGYVPPRFAPASLSLARKSMGSPEAGRRMSTATSVFDDEQDETANYGSYAHSLGRRSEAFSELGRVSLGAQSERYFAADRSARTSLALSSRPSLALQDETPPQSVSSPNRDANSSLSRISTGADEDVRAFRAFRLSDEEDEHRVEDRPVDYGEDLDDDEALMASLSESLDQTGGIDWDDVLRDVGQGGGDADGHFSFDPVSDDGELATTQKDTRNRTLSSDSDQGYAQDDKGPEEDEEEFGQENRASFPSKKVPKPPTLAKRALARKQRPSSKKMQRFTPSGAPLADLPAAKVRAMFERHAGGALSLSDEGVEAVLDASHDLFRLLMAEAAAVAHRAGRSSRVDGADLVVLMYRWGILSPAVSLSALGRQLGFDRELQSILDHESKRFELKIAKLLAGRKKPARTQPAAAGRKSGATKRTRAKAVAR